VRLSPRDPLLVIYHRIAAYVQFVGRNYDEAIQLARKAAREKLRHSSNFKDEGSRRRDSR
jgi:hypothetical protein